MRTARLVRMVMTAALAGSAVAVLLDWQAWR